MSEILAGLLASLVLALVFGIYVIVRGKTLVEFFKGLDENIAGLPDQALFYIILACFIGAALLFGTLSGLVYSWIGSKIYYTGLALGLAVVFSILAAISKQPLIPDKIVWNFAVGGVLGVLVPLLAG